MCLLRKTQGTVLYYYHEPSQVTQVKERRKDILVICVLRVNGQEDSLKFPTIFSNIGYELDLEPLDSNF